MTNATQHGMIGPDGQRILSSFLQLFGIMDHHLLAIFGGNIKLRGQVRG